jgi:bifunctional UDP-N-acetylglucosamine pyrophosphorylase/glucosamine-1-phosphate N-acetyltransferase
MINTLILAGGQGKRMKSPLPKVLHRVDGISMIQRVLNATDKLSIDKTIVIVGYEREMIKETLSKDIIFAVQEETLGTGHAIMCASNQLEPWDGDIMILSGDCPLITGDTLEKMLTHHRENKADATVMISEMKDPKGCGRIITNKGSFVKIQEEKDCTDDQKKINIANAGIYVFNIRYLWEYIHLVGNNNAQNEYYLPDVLPIFINKGKRVSLYRLEDNTEIANVNTQEQLKAINARF